MSAKKQNKKELNRAISAALFSDTERTEMWLADHWKAILGAAIIILVAIVGTFGIWKYRAYRNDVAVTALSSASTVGELEKNLAVYGQSDAAPAARYRLATMLLMKKDYKNAIAQYQLVANDSKCDAGLAENARFAAITCEELSGDLKKAAADYAIFGSDAKMTPARRAAADYAAARLLLDLGETKNAEAILGKNRLVGSDTTLFYWNSQLDALALSVKNGDYQPKKK